MAARRCSLCGVNYPDIAQFANCPIHGEATEPRPGSPDTNWQSRFSALKQEADTLARIIPRVEGVQAYCDKGLLWVDQQALFRAGLRMNSVGPSFKLFELDDGFVYETQGWDDPNRRWWVERVTTAVALPDPAEIEAIEASRAE